jgi:hypothetical protein
MSETTTTDESRTHAGEQAGETVQPEPEASPFKQFTFGVVLTQQEQTITFPGMEARWYVRAKAPDAAGERKIAGASLVGRQSAEMEEEAELRAGAYEVYLAKCEYQIVDFCLPDLATGKEVRFDVGNKGRNANNRKVYDHLSPDTANFVEGALDELAGRDTQRAKEYEALKNG